MNRDFKGIWISKEIWLSKDLTLQEKVFYVEIDSLDNENGCFASNGYFAEFFGISKTRVSLVIKSLVDKGYVKSTITYKEGTKQILNRVLNICYRPYLIKVKDPIQQKLKGNNTDNKSIIKNILPEAEAPDDTQDPFGAYNSAMVKMVRSFQEHVSSNKKTAPKITDKFLLSCCATVEKLERLDGHKPGEIKDVLRWGLKDEFWSNQILSLASIRSKSKNGLKKFDNLYNSYKQVNK